MPTVLKVKSPFRSPAYIMKGDSPEDDKRRAIRTAQINDFACFGFSEVPLDSVPEGVHVED